MAGGLPLGAFARQRRDFAHELCRWGSFEAAGFPNEFSAQLWNNANDGSVLSVYAFRLLSDVPNSYTVGFGSQEMVPGTTYSGIPLRGDQANTYGLLEGALDTPLTLPVGMQFDSTAQGVNWVSESPLFIVPPAQGLSFDLFGGGVYASVQILWAPSKSVTAGRTDLT